MSTSRPSDDRQQKAIQRTWERRRMFFWTVRQILLCVVLTALTVYLLVSLAEGEPPGADLLLRYLGS
jgi:hypothetical protein